MKAWQYARLKTERLPRLFIVSGKFKDKFAVCEQHRGSGKMRLKGDEFTVDLHYTAVEELDEFGQPTILPVIDMTGRAIEVGNFITYSVSTTHSHAMEIGKVKELTRTGAVKVTAIVRNGDKLKLNTYSKNEMTINDPFRSILLPVDDKTMIVWMMQDFEEMAKQM